jgi:6-phosphogluconolactonase
MTQAEAVTVYIGAGTGEAGPGLERSRGIYRGRLNAATGELAGIELAAELPQATFLALDGSGRRLYAVSEVGDYGGQESGAVAAFAVDAATGALQPLNVQPSGGSGPAYVSVDRSSRLVLAANYGGGSVACLPVAEDGRLEPPSQVVQHHGSGPNADRQDAPHAHCIVPDRANRYALAADLGIDRVLVYRLDPEAGTLRAGPVPQIPTRPGAGPRHLAFHPSANILYVSCELDSTVAVYAYDSETGAATEIQALSTLPEGYAGENTTSEVAVAPSGRCVYVANRGQDAIAIFAVDPDAGTLTLTGHQPTGGSVPRHFALDPTGQWLLVANQQGHNVTTLRVDAETGVLQPTGHKAAMSTPMCIRFATS